MCLTGDNMRKFNEIYEMMKYGYELINRAYTKEDSAKIHYALKSKIYNLFKNDKEEVEFYIEKIKLQNNNSFESYTSDYIKQMGIDKKCDDIKRLFILFSSNEIKDNLVSPIENDVNDQSKVYKILSYIGILWLIGLFVAEKDDKDLKFHVGQGMILTICEVALGLIVTLFNNLIIGNIFRTVSYSYFYGTTYAVSGFGMAIQGLLNLACFAIVIIYMVIGIKNAVSNKKNKLPLIGNWAFYK